MFVFFTSWVLGREEAVMYSSLPTRQPGLKRTQCSPFLMKLTGTGGFQLDSARFVAYLPTDKFRTVKPFPEEQQLRVSNACFKKKGREGNIILDVG